MKLRISLDALGVLDAIERRGSFAAAAAELHRVPSAVTYTVQKLEQDLGVTLFDRSGHRARLTAAGRKLLEEGRHLLRAAAELECVVRRVATGWETELNIAVGELIPIERIFPLVEAFYAEHGGTRLRLHTEVLGGTWDALLSGRADLVIGAANEGPAGGGYQLRPLGQIRFRFVVAPHHPLALSPEPLTEQQLLEHRVVAAADSSRNLPPRTAGILSGQDVLTVPSMEAKRLAQIAGLGVGHLPWHMVREDVAAGRLIVKRTETEAPPARLTLAWRTGETGKALQWFLHRLEETGTLFDGLFDG